MAGRRVVWVAGAYDRRLTRSMDSWRVRSPNGAESGETAPSQGRNGISVLSVPPRAGTLGPPGLPVHSLDEEVEAEACEEQHGGCDRCRQDRERQGAQGEVAGMGR